MAIEANDNIIIQPLSFELIEFSFTLCKRLIFKDTCLNYRQYDYREHNSLFPYTT